MQPATVKTAGVRSGTTAAFIARIGKAMRTASRATSWAMVRKVGSGPGPNPTSRQLVLLCPFENKRVGKIHNIELYPGKGGQLVRSAGTRWVPVMAGRKYWVRRSAGMRVLFV